MQTTNKINIVFLQIKFFLLFDNNLPFHLNEKVICTVALNTYIYMRLLFSMVAEIT